MDAATLPDIPCNSMQCACPHLGPPGPPGSPGLAAGYDVGKGGKKPLSHLFFSLTHKFIATFQPAWKPRSGMFGVGCCKSESTVVLSVFSYWLIGIVAITQSFYLLVQCKICLSDELASVSLSVPSGRRLRRRRRSDPGVARPPWSQGRARAPGARRGQGQQGRAGGKG